MNSLYFGDNLDALKQLNRKSHIEDILNHKTVNNSHSMKTTFKTAKREKEENKGQEKLF